MVLNVDPAVRISGAQFFHSPPAWQCRNTVEGGLFLLHLRNQHGEVSNMKKVLFIQHGDVDKPGLLAEVLAEGGIELLDVHPYAGEKLPIDATGFDGLVLGGGGQSAYEVGLYPYLNSECGLIQSALASQKPVLGLCLGAQLIARALGAEVRQAKCKEIGFFPVTLSADASTDPLARELPKIFGAAHWHGDVFETPIGGVRLASTALTPNQMFRYGLNCYGFQFHLEMTPALFEELVWDSQDYLVDSGVEPRALIREAYEVLPLLEKSARAAFKKWTDFL
jgi:GMP synthase (glutamine-hydrolysing)